MLDKISRAWAGFRAAQALPTIQIDLMIDRTASNDPYFARITRDFYAETQKRHPKFPLWKRHSIGVSTFSLDERGYEGYMKSIEASGRRNIKKAARLGYTVERINFNDHLDDISKVRSSTDVRQGEMPDEIKSGIVHRIDNPESNDPHHDYPYFAVLQEGKLWAYAGCMVAGEVCMIQHILGHAERLRDSVVPLLVCGIVEYAAEHFPAVKYVTYGTYFGASESMQRFKKKFALTPVNVEWLSDR